MTFFQKTIKYLAIGFASFLALSIFLGILNAIFGLLASVFSFDDDTVNDSFTYDNISSFDIEIDAGKLDIKSEGDSFIINVYDAHGFEHSLKDGTLFIEADAGLFFTSDGHIEIIIPSGCSLDFIDLEIGAGKANLENLVVNNLTADIGAGKLFGAELTVSNTDIEVGAGKASLEYDRPVSDFSIDSDSGIGNIKINDEKYDKKEHLNSGAKNNINVDVGVGKVSLDFSGQ